MAPNSILSMLLIIIIVLLGWKSINPVLEVIPVIGDNGIKGISALFTIQKSYTEQFYAKQHFIDLNAYLQNIMGVKMMNGMVKDSDGRLLAVASEAPVREKIESTSDSILRLYNLANQNEIPFIFVQVPSKFIEGETKLPPGLTDYSNNEYDIWLDIMKKNNIPTLDLREDLQEHNEFYKTDHHWTVRTSFYAANCVMQGIKNYFGRNYNSSYQLIQNYTSTVYKNSFLGSYGIKVGPYYAGKDDFEILVPKFDTDFKYTHLINHEIKNETSGSFMEAFIDSSLLKEDYYNKYNANLYGGYAENIIINNKMNDQSKLLLISHSFGRPMVQYLSLYFHEIRYLDPQDGRYNDSYTDYIRSFQPDYIVVMYNDNIPL